MHILQLYILQCENSFCLASDPQRKMSVSHLKKNEFTPAGVQARSPSHTFHPEATGAGGKVQSKKLYWLKRKLLHLQSQRIQLNSHLFTQLNDQTVLFQIIQFVIVMVCTQFKCQTVLFDP